MEHYTVLGRVGEGAHGIVMRARHNQSGDHMSPTRGAVTCWRCIAGQIVALKKIPLKRLEDGISEATIREIRALQQLDSVYIVKYSAPTPTPTLLTAALCRLYDVFPQGLGFVLVFECLRSDLAEVIKDTEQPLTLPEIK